MPPLHSVFEKRSLRKVETAQGFFEKLRSRGGGGNSFLLESGQTMTQDAAARYSYIGADPFLICRYQDGILTTEWRRKLGLSRNTHAVADPILARNLKKKCDPDQALSFVQKLFERFALKEKSPVPFSGGAAGYFGYDFGVKLAGVQQNSVDDLHLPDFVLMFVDKLIAIDHQKKQVFFLGTGLNQKQARENLKTFKKTLEQQTTQVSKNAATPAPVSGADRPGSVKTALKAHWSKPEYLQKIKKIRELIREGETYQVNFSQRFQKSFGGDPWNFYKKLSQENPVPFSSYFEFAGRGTDKQGENGGHSGNFQLISISPELLLRKRGRKLETWPIKGTIARGHNSVEDRKNIKWLLASTKDEAELAMITDLARNDLGRVCEAGSVKVFAEREIQKYRHVIHTVSKISGQLKSLEKSENSGNGAEEAGHIEFFAAFRALFPGGSITGCPKLRTIEIIDRLERLKRGIYTGSAGFIGFNGDSDLNILIRSAVVNNGKIYFHAGGGIVYDSVAEQEYEEVLAKAKSFLEKIRN